MMHSVQNALLISEALVFTTLRPLRLSCVVREDGATDHCHESYVCFMAWATFCMKKGMRLITGAERADSHFKPSSPVS